jgi:hypothetical protein
VVRLGGKVGQDPSRCCRRGRPPQAAARRAGLEFVEKLLTATLISADTTERNLGMPLLVTSLLVRDVCWLVLFG